ncbi:penicillin-insensitive murein endopeptidase [Massilia sp. Root335]|uniref:penicillin-insensitive murein endopeptidase n=1 Tax=Massilia sp. Root335 TaxID=1736517 RepID=UPI000A6881E5|nr:penicillin-insensitive murein endopeptidase [Massilia sp. Root335]
MDDDNDPLRPRPTEDSRGFFMLPQAPAESGYYTYGKLYGQPAKGAYQYPHPLMMSCILRVALEWQAVDERRIGIGDISLPDGKKTPDHGGHKTGLDVDVRPLRKDGLEQAVTWHDPQYDQEATRRLIDLFRALSPVKFIIFNDPRIPFVGRAARHDNHFHVTLLG